MTSRDVGEVRRELLRLIASKGYENGETRSRARELAELIRSSETNHAHVVSHSFSWVPAGALRERVLKVVAVRAGKSRGNPSYLISGEELIRAARTLALKPIDIDHLLFPTPIALLFPEVAEAYSEKWGIDVTRWAGTVLDAEAEDDRLEAIAVLDDPRVHGLALSGAFRGASVVEWARSESCSATDVERVCERRGVHFAALSLCLELEPAFEGTRIERISASQLLQHNSLVGLVSPSLTWLAGLHPPSAAIASQADSREHCDHSNFLSGLETEVPTHVPTYVLRDVMRRLEREVRSCQHSYLVGLITPPEAPRVHRAYFLNVVKLLREHLSKCPGLKTSGAKEVVCGACT
ncbi:MAG: hypothetical protein NZ988_06210 [Thaumarchaeota archaeon]|nr:hypothetical protein [Candidatus Calditenuaceae archaeon]MDW8187616.1 hypothetical protein [Nitrososphaerota archaeon]